MKVCLSAPNSLMYPQGGHLWVFLNWALGLRSCGCDVTLLDIAPTLPTDDLVTKYNVLRDRLSPFDLGGNIAVMSMFGDDLDCIPSVGEAESFDLLLDFRYNLPSPLLLRFRRTALINIDPGSYEMALSRGTYPPPQHHVLFSIGERAEARFNYTPPCVYLNEWPATPGRPDNPWTTVAHWWESNKRDGFAPYMSIPCRVPARFELALNLKHLSEQRRIEEFGFIVHDPHKIVATPTDYRAFIQNSAGEFSCAAPHYVKFQTAWISDRTLCYLASGRPCVVQHTGPSCFLPNDKGLHRFHDLDSAISAMNCVLSNYAVEAKAARSIAEEFFDATKVCSNFLTRAL
jgi:hypothetical protein